MSPRRWPLLIALVLAYAPAAWPADDDEGDDLLAPLTPADTKKPKKRKKAPPPAQPPPEKKMYLEQLTPAPPRLLVRMPDGPGGPVKNAHLFVDDKDLGVLPLEAVEAAPGEHRVSVKRIGYGSFNATVRVKDSGVTELLATLEPLAAVVDLTSEVAGAEVFVDGKSYGPMPINDLLLAPGSHQFRAR